MAQKKYLDKVGLERLVQNIDAKYAPLDSPVLIGIPQAPTAASGTKTEQIATTEFVQNEIQGITSALVFKGVVADVASLPAVADQEIGWTYNVATKGTTTADFVEGAGKVVDAGSNVSTVEVVVGVDYEEVTPEGTEDPAALGWFEYDSVNDEYFATTDTTVDAGKTYYEEVDVLGNKWDILGGVFDISELEDEINKRLEFGTTMPEGTPEAPIEDGRTFLYLGETSYKYSPVLGITAETNPAALGYFEEDGSSYAATADTEPATVYKAWSDGTDTFFTVSATPSVGDAVYTISGGVATDTGDTVAAVTADDIEVNGTTYARSAADDDYITEKTYYTREEEYVQGVIYKYDQTAAEWNALNSGDTFVEITNGEIDALFE